MKKIEACIQYIKIDRTLRKSFTVQDKSTVTLYYENQFSKSIIIIVKIFRVASSQRRRSVAVRETAR